MRSKTSVGFLRQIFSVAMAVDTKTSRNRHRTIIESRPMFIEKTGIRSKQ